VDEVLLGEFVENLHHDRMDVFRVGQLRGLSITAILARLLVASWVVFETLFTGEVKPR
jgi:hypothetical protein